MCKSLCTILFGQRAKTHGLEVDHLRAQDYRLQLELSSTLEQFLQMLDHSNARFAFKDTNMLKGKVPILESRKVFDPQGKFLRWEYRQLGPPGPEDMLTRAKNNEMKFYLDLVRNLAGVVINAGVAYMQENKIFDLDYDFYKSPHFNAETGEYDRASSQSSELTDPPTNNTFSIPQSQITELGRLGELQRIVGKVWQVSEQGKCAAKPDEKASKFIRSSKEYFSAETSCPHFISKILPDVTRQIESTTRDQVFSDVKGKHTKYIRRLDELVKSKLSVWKFFSSIISRGEAYPYFNEATIFRRRLVVCIMDEYRHGGPNGPISRFILTSDTGSREMNYVEVADKICTLFYVRAKRE
jgi:hypothetical protein